MSLMTARSLTVRREGRTLLLEASIDLFSGEVHALLGPNGAGKSTLLRALAGDWSVAAGEVTLMHSPLQTLDPMQQARRRAVLPQHDALAFGFTVAEMVALGRHAASDRRPAHEARIVREVLTATDTELLADRPYLELSGGERRRAQLARVLAQVWDQPQAVLLLDEPTHSLDLAHQHSVLQLLDALAARGFAVLISLHEINLAAAYAHRVSLLQQGRVIASGPTAAVLDADALRGLYGQDLQFTAVQVGDERQWLTARSTRQ